MNLHSQMKFILNTNSPFDIELHENQDMLALTHKNHIKRNTQKDTTLLTR